MTTRVGGTVGTGPTTVVVVEAGGRRRLGRTETRVRLDTLQ